MRSPPGLLDDARELVSDQIDRDDAVRAITPLQTRADGAVLLTTAKSGDRLVVKLAAERTHDPVSFERTAMLTALAASTGAPVPAVRAASDALFRGRWRYLITDYVDGVRWRELRPRLGPAEVAVAHRELGDTVRRLQSIRFPAFGEVDERGRPPAGQDVVAALRQRAGLRVHDLKARAEFDEVLDRHGTLFASEQSATLCHDDLHHDNVVFRPSRQGWRLAALLDWDKAWAGPAESDVARMAFWDDMTGPGFWQVYPRPTDADGDAVRRTLIYQLLWCLEYDDASPRHAADTDRLRRLLAVA